MTSYHSNVRAVLGPFVLTTAPKLHTPAPTRGNGPPLVAAAKSAPHRPHPPPPPPPLAEPLDHRPVPTHNAKLPSTQPVVRACSVHIVSEPTASPIASRIPTTAPPSHHSSHPRQKYKQLRLRRELLRSLRLGRRGRVRRLGRRLGKNGKGVRWWRR